MAPGVAATVVDHISNLVCCQIGVSLDLCMWRHDGSSRASTNYGIKAVTLSGSGTCRLLIASV